MWKTLLSTRHQSAQSSIVWDSLVACAALAVLLGVYFFFGHSSLFTSSAYHSARSIAPMKLWGALFILKGALAIWALVTGRWDRSLAVLQIGTSLYLFFAVLFLTSALIEPEHQGVVGALLCCYAAWSHFNLGRLLHKRIFG